MAKKTVKTTKFWWLYLVFGIIALIAGGNFCAVPISALSAITNVTGAFLIFAGASYALISIFDRKNIKLWFVHLILSFLIICAGLALIFKPIFAVKMIWLFAGLGFLFSAVSEIVLSINMKKENAEGWVAPLVLGIITGVMSLSILSDPIFGLSFMSIFVTVGVLCFGINLIILAFQAKPQK